MEIETRSLSLPKAGLSEAENEDAFRCDTVGSAALRPWRASVADGATESSFSRLWARMLVREFARRRLEPATRRPLPWFAEQKLEEGAHAAFIGLEILAPRDGEAGQWRAWALGDACLFRVTAGGWELAEMVPALAAEDFGCRPRLLSSRSEHIAKMLPHLTQHQADWHSGDAFYLLTDALAAWFQHQVEARRHPWKELELILGSRDEFAEWVLERRRDGTVRNDDITAVRVAVR